MHEAFGDIWAYAVEHDAQALCVLTNMTVRNGRLVMGAGQAREAKLRFPELPTHWGGIYEYRRQADDSDVLAMHWHLRAQQPYILVSFPTKRLPSDMADLELIRQSAQELVKLADELEWTRIVLPRPGCGLGGLKWEQVEPVLAETFDDRFTIMTNE